MPPAVWRGALAEVSATFEKTTGVRVQPKYGPSSLDFGDQGKVMREIRALAESGLCVLFRPHDPNHTMRAATRAYLLRDGKSLAEGPVGEVLTAEKLEALYRAPVQVLREHRQAAFLPG